jgi:hypothetical protein
MDQSFFKLFHLIGKHLEVLEFNSINILTSENEMITLRGYPQLQEILFPNLKEIIF